MTTIDLRRRAHRAVAFVVGSLLLLLCAMHPALALDSLVLKGVVQDKDGKPVANAVIKLFPSADGKPAPGKMTLQATSNKKGQFTFAFGRPGDFVLTVTTSDAVVLKRMGVKMKDADKHKPRLENGQVLEDQDGEIPAGTTYVPLGIPPNVFYCDLLLTVGPPEASKPVTAPDAGALARKTNIDQLNKAKDAIAAGTYDAAIAAVDKALEKKDALDSGDLGIAYYMKGYALFKQEKPAEAIDALKQSVAADDKVGAVWALLGELLAVGKQYDDAAGALRKALDLTTDPPARVPLLANLGKVLIESKKVEEAVAPLDEALKITPGDSDVRVNLIDAYTQLGKSEEAEKLISPDLAPGDAAALHFNIAANMFKGKRWEGAELHFRKALELDPKLVTAHRYRAEALLRLEKRAEAAEALESYLKASPNAPDAADTKQLLDAIKKTLPKAPAPKK